MNSELLEPDLVHRFNNQIAVALGFCNLLLDEMSADDPRRSDLEQIRQAIEEATALLPQIAKGAK